LILRDKQQFFRSSTTVLSVFQTQAQTEALTPFEERG